MKSTMKYKAVVFDLFGTLVNSYPAKQYQEDIFKIADVLEVDRQQFYDFWVESYDARALGKFESLKLSIADCLAKICRDAALLRLNNPLRFSEPLSPLIRWTEQMRLYEPLSPLIRGTERSEGGENKLEIAETMFLQFTEQYLVVKPDAVETLTKLRKQGFIIGLISDCTLLLKPFWHKLPFAKLIQNPIFSYIVKVKKPDPKIYQICCENLHVQPAECIYIGDGGSNELTGAFAVGMTPVLIKEDENLGSVIKYGAENWEGITINTLPEIFSIIEKLTK